MTRVILEPLSKLGLPWHTVAVLKNGYSGSLCSAEREQERRLLFWRNLGGRTPTLPTRFAISVYSTYRCGTVVTDFDWEAKTR